MPGMCFEFECPISHPELRVEERIGNAVRQRCSDAVADAEFGWQLCPHWSQALPAPCLSPAFHRPSVHGVHGVHAWCVFKPP